MADNSYWKKRQEQKFLAGEKKINAYYKELEKSFEQAKKEVHKIINDFVVRYGIENETTGGFAKAQRLLNKTEIGDLQEFIDLANANMGKYNQKLNNMSYKARITRYQALEKQIDAILQQMYAVDYQYKGEELLKEVYSDSYYQTWFNIDQYHGFHQEFAQINAQTVEELIKYPFNGADFSDRLWKQKDHMLQKLNESITTMLIQGKNPNTLSEDFAKKFGTKEFEAYRLLHTEGSFVMGQGTLAAYKEDGVEKYQILATLDMKTSDTCRQQDGKVYDVDKAVVGVTYWPFHMFCRTTDVPYYEDSDYSEDTRVARDPVTGKTYDVPADMKYSEWKDKYLDSETDELAENNNSGIVHAITDKNISKVPMLKIPGFSESDNIIIQEMHKKLLIESREENNSFETAYLLDESLQIFKSVYGDATSIDLGGVDKSKAKFIIHNHPNNKSFSTQDINWFIKNDNTKYLSIVKHNGAVEVLLKNEGFDLKNFAIKYKRSLKKYEKVIEKNKELGYDKAIEHLLNKSNTGIIRVR